MGSSGAEGPVDRKHGNTKLYILCRKFILERLRLYFDNLVIVPSNLSLSYIKHFLVKIFLAESSMAVFPQSYFKFST